MQPGDRIQDLTFDPPLLGTIKRAHETKPGVFYVHIDGGVNEVIIHARKLRAVGDREIGATSTERA